MSSLLDQSKPDKPSPASEASRSGQLPSKTDGGSLDEAGSQAKQMHVSDALKNIKDSVDPEDPLASERDTDEHSNGDSESSECSEGEDEFPEPPGFAARGKPTPPVFGRSVNMKLPKPRPYRPAPEDKDTSGKVAREGK
ncbi:hypothetical protein BKA70DRAFT_1415992 [Coprinopsis sp. MPI-PUGE-AT-0042]|nr:hypothetical protein BKA70DRAFT_1415992 [Coprinopsis sp. MPI-PUGE-AT-0042]